MNLKKLEKIKLVIGVWLWVDIVGGLSYLIISVFDNGNTVIALIALLVGVFLPLILYLLADAIYIAFKSIEK